MRPLFRLAAVVHLGPRPVRRRAAAADSWLGQRVFWKPGAKAKVGTAEVAIETIPFPATVEEVNGDWLWLGRAWVHKQDVATADQALRLVFHAQIRSQPAKRCPLDLPRSDLACQR